MSAAEIMVLGEPLRIALMNSKLSVLAARFVPKDIIEILDGILGFRKNKRSSPSHLELETQHGHSTFAWNSAQIDQNDFILVSIECRVKVCTVVAAVGVIRQLISISTAVTLSVLESAPLPQKSITLEWSGAEHRSFRRDDIDCYF